ncbi:MAG: ATP-binding cassette domain-containing protein, partial [Candidatus Woesearchaeota archaeon]
AKSIIAQTKFRKGKLFLKEKDLTHYKTWQFVKHGIAYFPQGGGIFPNLTVKENLRFAGLHLNNKVFTKRLNELYGFLPDIAAHKKQIKAGALSGGEKHLLSLQMVLLQKPDLLILDEPSAGLAPKAAEGIYESLNQIRNKTQISMLVIEQNVDKVLTFADRIILIKNKQIALETLSNETNLSEINTYYFNN